MNDLRYIATVVLMAVSCFSSPYAWAARTFETLSNTPDDNPEDSVMVDTVSADTVFAEPELQWPENIVARIDKLRGNDMFTTSTVGMLVYDLTADSVIYKYNEKQLMRPASTLKMIVTVAALDRLGHDYRYKTRLAFTGRKEGSALDGDIWCKGGFDPAFNSNDLNEFADSILRLGVDTIRGNLYADVSMKDSDLLGEGWCWDDDNPVLSPLLVSRKNEFMERLLGKLKKAGVTVEGEIKSGNMPRNAAELCVISRPLDDILPRLMKKSDNLYSESLFYNMAASGGSSCTATAATGRQMINRLISSFGLKPSKYYIADGSGLSLYNYVSPELEVEFLKYAYPRENIYPYLYELMPIAGVDGTLAKRMRNGYARDNVRAKTGTVTGVSALAGYCEAANGHVLCFSIINMGIRHASSGRRFQDRVCEALCRP